MNKILVAIDGSEFATKALDFALEIAEGCSTELLIISVVPPIKSMIPRFAPATPPTTFYNFFIDHVEKRLKSALFEALKRAKAKIPALKVSTKLLKGNPAKIIVQIANDEDVDMIVVGSRGLGNVEEFFLGSVSNKVANTATCPVLIVK